MDWLSVFFGASGLITGVPMVMFPARKRRNAIKTRKARLAELQAGSRERFFEERRSIEAYPPPSSDRRMRLAGVALMLGGLFLLVMAVHPKP